MAPELHLLKQELINRVMVEQNDQQIEITIKAKDFRTGNSLLTFFLSSILIAEFTVGYLMATKPAYIDYLFPILLFTTAAILVIFMRIWLWHLFGNEKIQIIGNQLFSNRSYGIFSTKPNNLNFNDSTSLYVNKSDKWSWKELRIKGVLRLTSNEKSIDFGKDLDYQEYEAITRLLSSKINEFKHLTSSTIINTNKETIEPGKVDTEKYNNTASPIKVVKSPFHKSA